jgi:transposase-like protein
MLGCPQLAGLCLPRLPRSVKFGLGIARRIGSTALGRGDKWHLDEVVVTINGRKRWLWRAVDQHGAVLDVLVQAGATGTRPGA